MEQNAIDKTEINYVFKFNARYYGSNTEGTRKANFVDDVNVSDSGGIIGKVGVSFPKIDAGAVCAACP